MEKIVGRIVNGGRVAAVAVRGNSGEDLAGRIVLLDALEPHPVLVSIVEGAAGVIARRGGVASHGAALLREAGLPTLTAVNFPDSWSGRLIILDGNVGVVSATDGGRT